MNRLIILSIALMICNHTNFLSSKPETCTDPKGNLHVIILAGGSGQRLWPFSTQAKPKQLLSIDNNQTLLEQTIKRVCPLVNSVDNIWVVTTQCHEQKIRAHINDQIGRIIVEPTARNTGPAIAYCCLELIKQNPKAQVLFVPADAFIPNNELNNFITSAQQAITCALNNNGICLLGVTPTFPATGYGYIEYLTEHPTHTTHKVAHFREKPSLETAQKYMTQQNMLWNTCMFAGKASHFIDEFKKHAPDLINATEQFINGKLNYDDIPSISIDYAVIEKSNNIWVTPCNFDWFDVGNVTTFLSLKKSSEENTHNHIFINSHNNLINVPNKIVALIDVDDICVIQTADALLITKKESAEKVRSVISSLKERNLDHFL